jgi:hypothetical protein
MTALLDLSPTFEKRPHEPFGRLFFNCPSCRLGLVGVNLVQGEACPDMGAHGCNKLPPDFATISITPSIAMEGKCRRCPGWHGFVTNGEVS